MGYKLVDDYSGEELDREHPGLMLQVGDKAWNLHLSDKSKDRLFEVLEDFTRDAEPVEKTYTSTARSTKGVGKGGSSVNTYGFDTKEVRAWAITNKVKQPNGKPVGERGRIPQEVYDQFKSVQKVSGSASDKGLTAK